MADTYANFRELARHERAGIDYRILARGFDVRRQPDPDLQGLAPRNLCNRGQTRKGVLLELSRALRLQIFESRSRHGPGCPLRHVPSSTSHG